MGAGASNPFREIQRFPLRRMAIALAIPPFAMVALLIWQVVLGHTIGALTMPNKSLVGWTIFLWILFFRLVTVKLETTVKGGELVIRLRGLWQTRRLPLFEISKVENVRFDPQKDYGGYGIRSTQNGTAYLAKGDQGVRITLKDGSQLVIGSQHAADLIQALTRPRPLAH